MINKTICNSKYKKCNISGKNYDSLNSAIPGNSRPYHNSDLNSNIASGPGFIPRRYLTSSGSTIIKSGSITHTKNVSAAPNPIKHWRRQLIPRENSGTGKASVGQIMDRPGGINHLQSNYNNTTNTINCVKTFIQNNPQQETSASICNNASKCNRYKRIRNITSYNENYHSSNSSYLQSRVKTYDQQMAIKQIKGNNYNTQPTESSFGSQNYHSQYIDNSNCLVSVIYKPTNNSFLHQGAVSSNHYTFNLKQKTQNLVLT